MTHTILHGALAAALLASPALGEPGHRHHADHHGAGPHGGRVEDAGSWHAELVVADGTVAVHLSDETRKPLPVAGFTATAILISGGKPTRITLLPEGDRLTGRADAPLPARPKGALRLAAPDGTTATARFE